MFGVRKATKEFCATLREILDENSRLKAENAKLRELVRDMYKTVKSDDETFADLRKIAIDELYVDFIGNYDRTLGIDGFAPMFKERMKELGIEVEDA